MANDVDSCTEWGAGTKGLACIWDRRHIAALSDGILPLSIKIEKILSDKGTICSNASNHDSPALRAATEPGGGGIRIGLAAGLKTDSHPLRSRTALDNLSLPVKVRYDLSTMFMYSLRVPITS